jgi:hypothetical protein
VSSKALRLVVDAAAAFFIVLAFIGGTIATGGVADAAFTAFSLLSSDDLAMANGLGRPNASPS